MTEHFDPETFLASQIDRLRPHCYSAHVPGQGYVNKGSRVDWRAEYERQYRRAAASELANLGYARAYAEPGYLPQPARGILFANWNLFPSDIDRTLEAEGYAMGWSDEWTTCDDCQRAFRTQPDSHDWRPAGEMFESDGEVLTLCIDCLQDWAGAFRADEIEAAAAEESRA